MKKLIIVLLVSILLTGCGSKNEPAEVKDNETKTEQKEAKANENTGKEQKGPSGYAFEHNGVKIYMNTDVAPVVDALGEPMHYFEAESCAFKGLDKTYTYAGFEITTYPLDGKDYISSLYFMDDTVSTPEGISIGSTVDEMIAAYGDNYTEATGTYTYVKDESKLQFIVMNDEIISITYLAIVEGLE